MQTSRPVHCKTSAYVSAGAAAAGFLYFAGCAPAAHYVEKGGMEFIYNSANSANGIPFSDGSRSSPYPVWAGWRGPGKYYLFAARSLETANPVKSLDELDRYNIAVYGRGLYVNRVRSLMRRHTGSDASGFIWTGKPNPNAPQEQKPALPIIGMPQVKGQKQWLSMPVRDALGTIGVIAAYAALIYTTRALERALEMFRR